MAAASQEVAQPIEAERPRDSDHAAKAGRLIRRTCRSARQPSVTTIESCLYGKPGLDYCDLSHIARFEPVLSLQHPNVMHASFAGR